MHRFFLCPLRQVVSLRHAGAVVYPVTNLRCGLVDSTKGLYRMEGPQWTGPDRPDRPAVARPAVARPTRTGPDYPCHTSILSYLPC